jgi:hypothetical protein
MPPLALRGVVSKVGFMRKTATVVVSRWAVHKMTGKVMFIVKTCMFIFFHFSHSPPVTSVIVPGR